MVSDPVLSHIYIDTVTLGAGGYVWYPSLYYPTYRYCYTRCWRICMVSYPVLSHIYIDTVTLGAGGYVWYPTLYYPIYT